MTNTRFDLQGRLISFSYTIITLTELFPKTVAGAHLGGQLVRSGSSVSLNHGEAQSAESRNDFIHKMRIGLKELREIHVSLKIIKALNWLDEQLLEPLLKECNELICIFVKSIQTAERNRNATQQKTKKPISPPY